MSAFDSTKTRLADLMKDIVQGKIQLPDFQRGWVWDDEHIRSLLTSSVLTNELFEPVLLGGLV